jgi:hypothetical protein
VGPAVRQRTCRRAVTGPAASPLLLGFHEHRRPGGQAASRGCCPACPALPCQASHAHPAAVGPVVDLHAALVLDEILLRRPRHDAAAGGGGPRGVGGGVGGGRRVGGSGGEGAVVGAGQQAHLGRHIRRLRLDEVGVRAMRVCTEREGHLCRQAGSAAGAEPPAACVHDLSTVCRTEGSHQPG